MINKLENPNRLAELNPKDTLKRIGLKDGDVFCDIGAGTGIFTFAAAEITKSNVYAVEISGEMLALLQSRVKELNSEKIITVSDIKMIPESSCKIVLLCTVLHELPEVPDMINEVKRILAKGGFLSIIEFHKRSTPMGPPLEHRLDSVQLAETLNKYGLHQKHQFTLGENFYCSVFGLEIKE